MNLFCSRFEAAAQQILTLLGYEAGDCRGTCPFWEKGTISFYSGIYLGVVVSYFLTERKQDLMCSCFS